MDANEQPTGGGMWLASIVFGRRTMAVLRWFQRRFGKEARASR